MALPTGDITFIQVRDFFGGSNLFWDYVRGGPYVPNIPPNYGISDKRDGLSLAQFRGADKYQLVGSLSRTNISNSVTTSGTSARVLSQTVTAYPSGGSGNYSYFWNYSAAAPISGNTGQSCQWYADFGVTGYVEFDWNCVVTDNVTGQQIVLVGQRSFLQKLYEAPPSCVLASSIMFNGQQASDFDTGHILQVFDPYSGEQDSLRVCDANTVDRECVTIVTTSGASLSCSTTAPIPVRGCMESLVRAPDALGHYVAVSTDPLSTDFTWEEVVEVRNIGIHSVRHIYIYDKCFWASDDGKSFILHHNTRNKQIV